MTLFPRLRHWIVGHEWRIASAAHQQAIAKFVHGSGVPGTRATEQAVYGFTEILERCHCGKTRVIRLIGDHSGVKSDSEIEQLERMAR